MSQVPRVSDYDVSRVSSFRTRSDHRRANENAFRTAFRQEVSGSLKAYKLGVSSLCACLCASVTAVPASAQPLAAPNAATASVEPTRDAVAAFHGSAPQSI
jgi:hypothetical protein